MLVENCTDDRPGMRDDALLDLRIGPYRSLPPAAFTAIVTAVGIISFSAGLAFYLIGAWPVIGFLGVDVLLVYVALKLSYRQARAYEWLRLTPTELTVEQVSARGQRSVVRFAPYWLRVEFDEPPTHASQLRLTSHGRSLVLGAFLAPADRQVLARRLRTVLGKLREPVLR